MPSPATFSTYVNGGIVPATQSGKATTSTYVNGGIVPATSSGKATVSSHVNGGFALPTSVNLLFPQQGWGFAAVPTSMEIFKVEFAKAVVAVYVNTGAVAESDGDVATSSYVSTIE